MNVKKIKFFVCNLKESFWFKVGAHSPKTLDEAYSLAMNVERKVNSNMERNKGQLVKIFVMSNYSANQNSKSAKISNMFKP